MAKLISSETITTIVPKIVETPDCFVINGQVYDKHTLEPKKLQTVPFVSSDPDSFMDIKATVDVANNTGFFDDNTVIIDKYESEYSYLFTSDRGGCIRYRKIKTTDDKIEVIYDSFYGGTGNIKVYSQDVKYIYGVITFNPNTSYMFKLTKKNGALSLSQIFSSYSQVTLMKDTALYIYIAATRYNDQFSIIKYNKSSEAITTIYSDNGSSNNNYYTYSTPMLIDENEVLTIRCNKTFNNNGINNLILKKYLIDYTFDKVYEKNVSLDCSSLPKGFILSVDSSESYYYTKTFTSNDEFYFTIFNRKEQMLYVVKRISESHYKVIQQYELALKYNGVIPYNDGKTLFFYTSAYIDCMSFRALEEKFELTSTISGDFKTLCIDKNKLIWLQHKDNSVDMIGINVPTIAEALFVDTELNYSNQDIESKLEVFAKNFDGKLLEADVEVILNGPAYFTDTGSKKKKIRTSANSTLRIPITINNSGYIEANTIIL